MADMRRVSAIDDIRWSRNRLSAHLWTIGPALLTRVRAPHAPPSRPFRTSLPDPSLGKVRLSGILSEIEGSDTLVLIVHGLSGNALSPYCTYAARAVARAGFSSLRLSMRGADFSGEDIFHGGTTEDLRAALSAPEIARYRRILLLGYSVGGHIVLRAAIDEVDPRVQAAAAICPPLDLDTATVAFDHPSRRPYQRPIFRDLNRAYRAAAVRGRVPIAPWRVERARSSRERDSLTVVVRFGFRSIKEYYERESVAPRLHRLRMPALVVANVHDPIVPPATLTPALRKASSALSTIWTNRGGHVYFPSYLHLRQPAPPGLESQVIHWLGSH